jgi:nitrite reductase/ring-hydroxylating ferredoxin subunit
MPIPDGLRAPGTDGSSFEAVADVAELPPGALVRVTRGDLDVLLAHTDAGLVATDDRCPHMSAPLSLGSLDGCVVACPLHSGRFDLSTGEPVQFPTTGGLDADGNYHPPSSPGSKTDKPEPSETKARVRALTRVRRIRYYPLRINGEHVEVALPR